MPNSPVVEIKNISKKYTLYHEHQTGYSTLVDTLSTKAKKIIQRLRDPLQKTKRLDNSYEEFRALDDVSFNIAEGDRVGIVGKNGAGKSTLLKILSRITEPSSGSVKIRGRVSSLLEVGTGFHPELTGRENIFLNGAILGMKRQEIIKKFDDIVAFGDIEKFLDTPVKRFSSGMYMRLGFAIAAHLDPDVFIVDEVLAVGDSQFQEKCLKKLNDLSSNGRTVIFVSHDIGSILNLCNKGIYLDKGRLIESGPIDHCVSEYLRNCRSQALSWEGNEGDEHVRFYKASLELEQGDKEFCYQNETARCVIEYEVLKHIPELFLGISVWNQRNQKLARSYTFTDIENFQQFNQVGKHRVSFDVNAGLFYEDEYIVKVECHIHNSKAIIKDEITLKFHVYPEKQNTRFANAGEKGGVFLGNCWKKN